MADRALHQRVSAVRMMFSMWLTEDVMAKRADHLTDAERTVVSRCALCGEEAKGRRNEHLLSECTSASGEAEERGGGSSGEESKQVGEAWANEGVNNGATEAG